MKKVALAAYARQEIITVYSSDGETPLIVEILPQQS
jgi:hypothetical protein